MAYNTYYKLTWEPESYSILNPEWIKIVESIGEESANQLLDKKLLKLKTKTISFKEQLEKWLLEKHKSDETNDMLYALNSEEPTSWYTYREDMIELSKAFPEILFTLHGEGEEATDLWCEYYFNGQVQRAEAIITYEPCNLKLNE